MCKSFKHAIGFIHQKRYFHMATSTNTTFVSAYKPKRIHKRNGKLCVSKLRVNSSAIRRRKKNLAHRPVSLSITVPPATSESIPEGSAQYLNSHTSLTPSQPTFKSTLPTLIIYLAIGAAFRLLQH